MASIGTRTHAREIHTWYTVTRFEGRANRDIPQGWEKVGEGSFRAVFLHIATNVTYKITTYSGDEEYGSRGEVRKAQRLYRKAPNGDGRYGAHLRIPRCSGFRIGDDYVAAMEYVKGRHLGWTGTDEAAEGRIALFLIGKFLDMHQQNYIVEPSGCVVPVDMGSTRRSRNEADLRVLRGLDFKHEEQERRERRWMREDARA